MFMPKVVLGISVNDHQRLVVRVAHRVRVATELTTIAFYSPLISMESFRKRGANRLGYAAIGVVKAMYAMNQDVKLVLFSQLNQITFYDSKRHVSTHFYLQNHWDV